MGHTRSHHDTLHQEEEGPTKCEVIVVEYKLQGTYKEFIGLLFKTAVLRDSVFNTGQALVMKYGTVQSLHVYSHQDRRGGNAQSINILQKMHSITYVTW